MKNGAVSLALRIAEIINSNSPKDVSAAIKILKETGFDSELLSFVSASVSRAKVTKVLREGAQRPSVDRGLLKKRLMELRASNPSAYHQIARFERELMDGLVLPTPEDLKRFGQAISKRFKSGKSRADTVAALMVELSALRPNEIETVIRHAIMSEKGGADLGEFKDLAHFLIGSKTS